ncbi:MAG: DUF1003 domain-containing protein [Kaiparowitsia implicata GSE-PSE-MK54-09C]|jgi:uncharacterized membrane protein|nr:DUF1003 domain-containing protein [Kaiparowitsia implicata GSE-PSE-MK54-09C]
MTDVAKANAAAQWQMQPQRIITAPLPEPIAENIEAIIEIHRQETQDIPVHERLLGSIAAFFSRPVFLYTLTIVLGLWLSGDLINHTELLPFALPTFSWTDQGLDAAALLISTGVLIRQSREESFAKQRTQLMLQLSLLSEKKIAKIIALLEEFREDLPHMEQRYDPEAEVMKEATNPLTVLEALKQNLKEEIASEVIAPLINKDCNLDQQDDVEARNMEARNSV